MQSAPLVGKNRQATVRDRKKLPLSAFHQNLMFATPQNDEIFKIRHQSTQLREDDSRQIGPRGPSVCPEKVEIWVPGPNLPGTEKAEEADKYCGVVGKWEGGAALWESGKVVLGGKVKQIILSAALTSLQCRLQPTATTGTLFKHSRSSYDIFSVQMHQLFKFGIQEGFLNKA